MAIFGLIVSTLIFLLYAGMLWYYFPRASAQKKQSLSTFPFVSVIVPARNEALQIDACLQSLLDQTYPKDRYEIIVIDDHSEDATPDLVQAFAQKENRVRLLFLHDFLAGRSVVAHKKAALQYGVQEARGEFILSTDADCEVSEIWMQSMLTDSNDFLLGPVRIAAVDDLLSSFQALDLCGVMMLTAGSAQKGQALLANGANLGFRRKLFQEIDGYAGVDHIASGDDVLLLQKVQKAKLYSIGFVDQKEAMVKTLPETSWSALWRQRLRWASKTGSYTDYRLVVVQGISFAICWAAILAVVLPLFINGIGFWPTLIFWLGKMGIDYLWLRSACQRFGEGRWMRWFVPAFLLHTLYVAVIGFAAMLSVRNQWKGRAIE